MEEEVNAEMEKNKRISEGMKAQIGKIRKRRINSEDDSKWLGSSSCYLDVIFSDCTFAAIIWRLCAGSTQTGLNACILIPE